MKKNKSIWHIAFRPIWKLATSGGFAIFGVLVSIRDELLPDNFQNMLHIRELFNVLPWYMWIIAGLVLFMVLKASEVHRALKKNDDDHTDSHDKTKDKKSHEMSSDHNGHITNGNGARTVIAGDRGVAVGGSSNGATIVTGDGNVVGMKNLSVDHQKAVAILKMELETIDNFILPAFSASDNKMQLASGEIKEFTGISLTEIPNFKKTLEADILLSLNDSLRNSSYSLSTDLDNAEKFRKLALPLLGLKERASELDMYGTIYLGYLRAARDKIDRLKIELQ